MGFVYKPLQKHDIRLLTLQPANSDELDLPIICTLEHVELDPESQNSPAGIHESRNWPELEADLGTDGLFKDSLGIYNRKRGQKLINTLKDIKSPFSFATSQENLDIEKLKTWRYDWGDYMALSYVWGTQEPSHCISLNGTPFVVGPNLHAALKQLRGSELVRRGYKLWIDAICINQSDLAERSQQVVRMGAIYRSAWQVVSWLGSAADDSDLAMRTIRCIANVATDKKPPDGLHIEHRNIDAHPFFAIMTGYVRILRQEVYKALYELLARPYWSRVWIIQEAAMANLDSPVYCGGICVAWSEVARAVQLIELDKSRLGRDIIASGAGRSRIFNAQSHEYARDRVVERENKWSVQVKWTRLISLTMLQQQPETLDQMKSLQLVKEAATSNEKDRVYGILETLSLGSAIVPDYSLELADIYTNFMLALLRHGELDALRLVSRQAGSIQHMPGYNYTTASVHWPPTWSTIKLARRVWRHLATETMEVGVRCDHNLSSWVVCWTCKQAPIVPLPGDYAAGGLEASHVIIRGGNALLIRGVLFDALSSLGSFHAIEDDETYPQNSTEHIQASIYGTFEATQRALWNVMVAGTTSNGGKAPDLSTWIQDPRLWTHGRVPMYTNGFGLHDVRERDGELLLGGYKLNQLIYGERRRDRLRYQYYDPAVYEYTPEQNDILVWSMNVKAWRRLMGTMHGRMGLAPAAARLGDKIAIVLGCSAPLVLRPTEDGAYTLIGECYVEGVMYGEVLEGSYEVEELVLS